MLTLKQEAKRYSLTKADLLQSARNVGLNKATAEKIWIDDVEYTGYLDYTFAYLKTYPKSPSRSTSSGVIKNLNSFSSFLTPTLTIQYKFMRIDTYRRLTKQLHSKNEFLIKCYDVENDCFVTLKMYFEPEDAPELFRRGLDFLAAIDYTIQLVGTNESLGLFSVVYNSNPPSGTGASNITQSDDDEYVDGEEIIIGDNVPAEGQSKIQDMTFNDSYSFYKWNTKPDGTGVSFIDRQSYTISSSDLTGESLVLYAVWQSVEDNNYTLSYNYGIGDTYIDETTGSELYSKKIRYMEAYGDLPSTQTSFVTYCEKQYMPYISMGWYKTPQIVTGSEMITPSMLYIAKGNTTIYQIFESDQYTVTFDSNGASITPPSITMKYGQSISLPQYITKDGYKFLGWQDIEHGGSLLTSDTTTVPPTNITLVAQWESNNV